MATTIMAAPSGSTEFLGRDNNFWLARLCGLPVGRQGEETGPARTRGMALVQADGHRYEGPDLTLEACEEKKSTVRCRWRVGESALRLCIAW